LHRKEFRYFSSAPTILLAAAIVGLPIVVLIAGKQTMKLPSGLVQPPGNSALQEKITPTSGVEKVCFVRGDWIYLAELGGKSETRLAQGQSPQLSPMGDSVVFISVQQGDDAMARAFPPAGRLQLLELKTMKTRNFTALDRDRIGDPI
jgi:hypothetical protein